MSTVRLKAVAALITALDPSGAAITPREIGQAAITAACPAYALDEILLWLDSVKECKILDEKEPQK